MGDPSSEISNDYVYLVPLKPETAQRLIEVKDKYGFVLYDDLINFLLDNIKTNDKTSQ